MTDGTSPGSATGALGAFVHALTAFIAPGAAVLATSVLQGSSGGESVSAAEWVTAAVACVVASAAGEARAERRVGVEARRGEATAQRLRDGQT